MTTFEPSPRPPAHGFSLNRSSREAASKWVSVSLAADMLMAAVHGTIVFPCMTRTMDWSDTWSMVKKLVTTIVMQWSASGIVRADVAGRT